MLRDSTCETMELGLLLGVAPQRVRTQVDLISSIIEPIDRVSIFAELHLVEVGSCLQPSEDFSARQQRAKINDTLVPVGPYNLEHAVNDGVDRHHSWKHFVQSILPISS